MMQTDESPDVAAATAAAPERPYLDIGGSRVYACERDGVLSVEVVPGNAALPVTVTVGGHVVAATVPGGPRGRHARREPAELPARFPQPV